MSNPKTPRGSRSSKQRKAFLSILPISMFWGQDNADDPLIGIFRRLPPRATALFAFLASRMDMESGEIRGDLAAWCRPEAHGRDPKTVRLALAELERVGLVEWHETDNGRRPFAGERYWTERCFIRGRRNMNAGGRAAWVQHRETMMRGGPWQALTDTARVLWLFMRALAPLEARKSAKGKPENANPVSQEKIAARTALSKRCITDGLAMLERAGLVRVHRKRRSDQTGRYLVNVYSVVGELRRRVAGRFVDFQYRIVEQLRGAFGGKTRAQDAALVAWWWHELGRAGKPPARLRALIA